MCAQVMDPYQLSSNDAINNILGSRQPVVHIIKFAIYMLTGLFNIILIFVS